MTHALTITPRYTQHETGYGPTRLLAGYVGVCSCGSSSQLYGIEEPCRQWFAWHIDPTGRKARATRRGIR